MNNDDRCLELLAELVVKQDSTIDELKFLNNQVGVMKGEIVEMKGEIVEIKEEIIEMKEEIIEMKEEIVEIRIDMGGIKTDIHEMKEDIKKLNLISAENSRAILKLANLLEGEVLTRIAKLEAEVFHR